MQLPVGCRVTAQAHYDWIIQDTDRYIATLGVTYKYLHEDSPFRKDAPRSPVIETYQRNQALNYSYRYGTFRLNFHHIDHFELDLRGYIHVRGAAFSCLRLKWADIVLI